MAGPAGAGAGAGPGAGGEGELDAPDPLSLHCWLVEKVSSCRHREGTGGAGLDVPEFE